jgi:diphthine synthase
MKNDLYSRIIILFAEYYTSVLCADKEKLEAFYGKEILLADREMVESVEVMDEILRAALSSDVAFLVVGDPLCATTHTDLILRATERGVEYKVIHNASGNNSIQRFVY